jgi:hypothetical protein
LPVYTLHGQVELFTILTRYAVKRK